LTIYPNPVINNTFYCSFKSLKAEALILKIIETETGRVLYTQTVNRNVRNNNALITLSKGPFLNTNNYIVILQGVYSLYETQKILIKN